MERDEARRLGRSAGLESNVAENSEDTERSKIGFYALAAGVAAAGLGILAGTYYSVKQVVEFLYRGN
jgi:hypothetical protein